MSVEILKLEEVESIKVLGGTLKRMFNPGSVGAMHMTFSVGYFSPGEGLKAHIHPESEEVYYVVRGTGTVYIGEERKPVKVNPDTALYIPPGMIHGIKNSGSERLVVNFFVAPGKEQAIVL